MLMSIAATGFVSEDSGSIPSANALLLKGLLESGHSIDFFSKPSFVDPRHTLGDYVNFHFHDATNAVPDTLRRLVQRIPVLGFLASRLDALTYNRLLLRLITRANVSRKSPYDVVLWMGDYAHGKVKGVPTISFAQGPPGTDARSILRRRSEVRRLAGTLPAIRLELLARLRLSSFGLPDFNHSDHIIVGSNQSKRTLVNLFEIKERKVSTMPYPIDLGLFRPSSLQYSNTDNKLRVLWLGRIVPRKRLDFFLDGSAEAIRRGVNLTLTVVGRAGFVSGYHQLLDCFPFPDRLEHLPGISRAYVPELLARHDVLCQPSEEEDFGSSIAEAQACGLRVIVGNSNGNSDYLSSRDWLLPDDNPESLSLILSQAASDLFLQDNAACQVSRQFAERNFSSANVVKRLESVLLSATGLFPGTA
jgi:glycosyltransferase involved in cell wall biosynthesis